MQSGHNTRSCPFNDGNHLSTMSCGVAVSCEAAFVHVWKLTVSHTSIHAVTCLLTWRRAWATSHFSLCSCTFRWCMVELEAELSCQYLWAAQAAAWPSIQAPDQDFITAQSWWLSQATGMVVCVLCATSVDVQEQVKYIFSLHYRWYQTEAPTCGSGKVSHKLLMRHNIDEEIASHVICSVGSSVSWDDWREWMCMIRCNRNKCVKCEMWISEQVFAVKGEMMTHLVKWVLNKQSNKRCTDCHSWGKKHS